MISRPLRALIHKELLRFPKILTQALISPTISVALYMVVFGVALSGRGVGYEGYSFQAFLLPGLIMMQVINNAFSNSGSSLMISKYQGNLVDVLLSPLHPLEFVLGYAAGGIARAMGVALCSTLVGLLFTRTPVAHPLLALLVVFLAALFFSLLGIAGGVLSESFDGMSAYTTFIILPLTYLGGVFYSVHRLPPWLATLSQLNPLFYLIDALRFAYLGVSDVSLGRALLVMVLANALALALPTWIVYKGYRLRT